MKAPLFEYPSYQYQIDDWEFKKKGLLNRINSQKFVRTTLQTFETDRSTNNKSYITLLPRPYSDLNCLSSVRKHRSLVV
jgi:hypothetical protein